MGRLSRPEELRAPQRNQMRRRRGALVLRIPAGLGRVERSVTDAAQVAPKAEDRAIPSGEELRRLARATAASLDF